MRALDPEVVDAVWAAVEPLLPRRADGHPLGCHNPRISDRVCFWGILVRLVTGCSWVTVERLLGKAVSDTTLRGRRDEWVDAGVFDRLCDEAIAAFDRIVGLDLEDAAADGSAHKAPCGGAGTGKSPVDRGKSGWKWSILCDRGGIPVGWAADGANRNDCTMLEPTLADAARRGLHLDIGTLHLDRGYAGEPVLRTCLDRGIDDIERPPKRPPGKAPTTPGPVPLGMRWAVERTNSWLSNYGQLRRNTDRQPKHRQAQLAFAIALLITAKLIDHKNRWNP